MRKLLINIFLAGICCLFYSCNEEDYRIDGGLHSPFVDMTTFDFLSTHPELDLFGYLIDKAGYSDLVNTEGATVFVADNMAVRKYLNRIWVEQFEETGSTTAFTIDDVPMNTLTDSLRIYIVKATLTRETLDETGTFYETELGDSIHVTLEERFNDPVAAWEGAYIYSQYMRTVPEFIFMRRRIGMDWDDPDAVGIDPVEKDKYEVIKTSGIRTTTGVVHIIGGARDSFFDQSEAHTLFFRPGKDKASS